MIHFSSARRDLFWLVVLALSVFTGASWFEVSEYLLELSRPFEFLQLDEVPLTLLILSLGLVWFSRRRWQEARQEVLARKASEQALAASREQLRQLTRQGLATQEGERRALARELHDELGQTLNAIKLDAVAIRAANAKHQEGTRQAAASIIALTDHAHAVVRGIIGRLRPVALDELGLPGALEHLRATWQRHLPSLEIRLHIDTFATVLDEIVAMTLYRLAQEGLNNIVRHAGATKASIRLKCTSDGIELTIGDDGRGFDPPSLGHPGLGLIGMRERAEALGGSISIDSAPGRGCVLRACLPYPKERRT